MLFESKRFMEEMSTYCFVIHYMGLGQSCFSQNIFPSSFTFRVKINLKEVIKKTYSQVFRKYIAIET